MLLKSDNKALKSDDSVIEMFTILSPRLPLNIIDTNSYTFSITIFITKKLINATIFLCLLKTGNCPIDTDKYKVKIKIVYSIKAKSTVYMNISFTDENPDDNIDISYNKSSKEKFFIFGINTIITNENTETIPLNIV